MMHIGHYRANFEFLAKHLIHSLDSGDFSVSAKKKINSKKSNNYGIWQHILEEVYADLKEINEMWCNVSRNNCTLWTVFLGYIKHCAV